VFENVANVQDGHAAIKTMKTRGAPAIAIVAALSLAVDANSRLERGEFNTVQDASQFLQTSLEYLKTSRPTAVNLFDAAAKLSELISTTEKTAKSPSDVITAYLDAAEQMLVDDVKDNKNIGKYGAQYIVENAKDKDNICVLTHCNTG
jgi:methylthioribose-1-phosphate isomerase